MIQTLTADQARCSFSLRRRGGTLAGPPQPYPDTLVRSPSRLCPQAEDQGCE